MNCPHFDAGRCQSCTWLPHPYGEQLQAKQAQLAKLLAPFGVRGWLPPVSSPETAFRNKAKMAALGAAHAPILGIMGPQGEPVSLTDCPLYPEGMQQLLARLQRWVQQAGLPPYRIDKAKGELKYLLLTRSESKGEYLLRFVLRSEQAIPRIRTALPLLLADFPAIRAVSVNIQPVHMAILEGEQEIFLTDTTRLEEEFNGVPLYIRPKSFFQTNPAVAAKLYQTARDWTQALRPIAIWDLFCGVGGFGLHCASPGVALTGIEIEAEAIACAKDSAAALGLQQVSFMAMDSDGFAGMGQGDKPDLVITNPPRRGLGNSLCGHLVALGPAHILYSSCNPDTFVRDLASLPGYATSKVQLFDMFPHTGHFEVLALLERQAS